MRNALAQRGSFPVPFAQGTQLPTRAPTSPMVLEGLLDLLAQLNEKVTALERRSEQQIVPPPTSYLPVQAQPVDHTLASTSHHPIRPEPSRSVKVHRAQLLEFFD